MRRLWIPLALIIVLSIDFGMTLEKWRRPDYPPVYVCVLTPHTTKVVCRR